MVKPNKVSYRTVLNIMERKRQAGKKRKWLNNVVGVGGV
jgi:hypothetical protein